MLIRMIVIGVMVLILAASPGDRWNEQGQTEFREGRYRSAARSFETAVKAYTDVASKEDAAAAAANLAQTFRELGEFRKADRAYLMALEFYQGRPGWANVLTGYAGNLLRLHRVAEAEAAQRQALDLPEASTPAVLLVGRSNLADILTVQGRLAEARPLLERNALELQGSRDVSAVRAWATLGASYAATAELARAEDALRKALSAAELIAGPEHPDTGRVALVLSRVLARAGNKREGRALQSRGAAILAKAAVDGGASLTVDWRDLRR